MERAATRVAGAEQSARRHADHGPAGKHYLQGVERDDLRWRAIDGHDHHTIGDDEIQMRGGRHAAERVAVKSWTWDTDHFELTAFCIGRLLKGSRDPVQGLRVRVVGTSWR